MLLLYSILLTLNVKFVHLFLMFFFFLSDPTTYVHIFKSMIRLACFGIAYNGIMLQCILLCFASPAPYVLLCQLFSIIFTALRYLITCEYTKVYFYILLYGHSHPLPGSVLRITSSVAINIIRSTHADVQVFLQSNIFSREGVYLQVYWIMPRLKQELGDPSSNTSTHKPWVLVFYKAIVPNYTLISSD